MLKKIFTLSLLCLILPLCLPSCTVPEQTSCRELISLLTSAEKDLPSGKIYNLSAPEGESEYLPEHLINTLFGDGEKPPQRNGWLDAALFLPNSSHPCEFAVILCDSKENASDTARLLLSRLDKILTLKSNDEYSALLENASVTVIGNHTLLVISSDTQNAIKTVSKAIT